MDKTIASLSAPGHDSRVAFEVIEALIAAEAKDGNPDGQKYIPVMLAGCDRSLREALRKAQRSRDACQEKRDRIREALERATSLTAMLATRLTEFLDLDKAIAEAFAASILRSTESSAEATLGLELPPELKQKAERKFSVENQLASATQAAERLRQDLAVAESEVKVAVAGVDDAAVAVVAYEVEPIAEELARIEDRAAMLRSLLLGYGAQRHAGGFLPMSRATARLLRCQPKNAVQEGSTHHRKAGERWRFYMHDLSIDSAATLRVDGTQNESRRRCEQEGDG